jgi:endogenous inhibitor of DNA gyrase (YacG/DUF329 family)
METRTCEYCQREFARPYHVGRPAWAKRRYCSRACLYAARKRPPVNCQRCGKEFTPKPQSVAKYCSQECAYASRSGWRQGDKHPSWKGGRHVDNNGYINVLLTDDHQYASMRRNHRYALEHRIVMAESLGRTLERHETVHHKNGDRQDNRIENLQLRNGRHGKGHSLRCRACGSTDIEHLEI